MQKTLKPLKSPEYRSTNIAYQPFIEDQNQCCLCGSKLEFKHKIDYQTLKVREDADCPTCGIRLKSRDFGLN